VLGLLSCFRLRSHGAWSRQRPVMMTGSQYVKFQVKFQTKQRPSFQGTAAVLSPSGRLPSSRDSVDGSVIIIIMAQ